MARAFNPKTVIDYVPLCDRQLPAEQQTTFQFRLINVFEDMELSESFKEAKANDLVSYGLAILRRSLVGWKNFPMDEAGTPAPFVKDEDGRANDETIKHLGGLIVEVFTFALSVNGVTKDAVGKSSRQSTQLAVPRTPAAPTADATQPASAE